MGGEREEVVNWLVQVQRLWEEVVGRGVSIYCDTTVYIVKAMILVAKKEFSKVYTLAPQFSATLLAKPQKIPL